MGPDVVIEQDLDLLAGEHPQEVVQVAVVEPVLEQPRHGRARGIQAAFEVTAHIASTVVHAIVRIGALDRIAQLDEQLGPAEEAAQALRRLRVRQIARRLLANQLARTRAREMRPIPVLTLIEESAEVMQLRAGHEHLRVRP